MRLTHVRVQNYKSIEDSNEFSIGDVTCLVGKNEAGKTAILQALHTLNPDSGDAKFDAVKSYPRRSWSEYEDREEGTEAVVLTTKWQIDEKEIQGLKALLGAKAVIGNIVTISKSYQQTNTNWTMPVDEEKAASFIVDGSGLHEEEKVALRSLKSIDEIKVFLKDWGRKSATGSWRFSVA